MMLLDVSEMLKRPLMLAIVWNERPRSGFGRWSRLGLEGEF